MYAHIHAHNLFGKRQHKPSSQSESKNAIAAADRVGPSIGQEVLNVNCLAKDK